MSAPGPMLRRASGAAGQAATARKAAYRTALLTVLAFFLGALQTLSYVHTAWWPLPILTLTALLLMLQSASSWRSGLWGWAYGTGWLVAGVWWLFISMHRYGGLPAPLAIAAVAALSAALSLYLGLACAAYARWRRGRVMDAALFAGLWLLAELARGVIFTGFPWLAVGYSQIDSPIAALAPWTGVYGMGLVVALLAGLLAQAVLPLMQPLMLRLSVSPAANDPSSGEAAPSSVNGAPALPSPALSSQTRKSAGLAGLWAVSLAVSLLALMAAAAHAREFTTPVAGAGPLSVTLLQPNVGQDEKFMADRIGQTLAWIGSALLDSVADLVVAPETAVPLLPKQLEEAAPGFWAALQAHFGSGRAAALVGVPLGSFEAGYTNSIIGLSAASAYRYDKHHLVPFGEFIPTGFRWFTKLMQIPLGDFARGVPNPPSMAWRGQRLAPNICYEDLFGEELARRFIDPQVAPTIFVNLSNIGWFGDTIAVGQHLNISRMRSLEFQLPMLRATNTGATAFIDHRGVVRAQLKAFTQGSLEVSVEGRSGVTPFAWWAARWGLWPLWTLALLWVVAATAWRRRLP